MPWAISVFRWTIPDVERRFMSSAFFLGWVELLLVIHVAHVTFSHIINKSIFHKTSFHHAKK